MGTEVQVGSKSNIVVIVSVPNMVRSSRNVFIKYETTNPSRL